MPMSRQKWHELKRQGAVLLSCLLLLACQPRDETRAEVQGMLEAIYPGQFELLDAHLHGDLQGHVLTFKSRQDDNFRVKLNSRDMVACRSIGCRDRIERAHAQGKLAADRLNASVAALRECEVPLLGLAAGSDVPVLEVDILGDTEAVLKRLSPCVERFRQAMRDAGQDDSLQRQGWSLRLQQSGPSPGRQPERISWETHADEHPQVPRYALWLKYDAALPPATTALRLSPNGKYSKAQQEVILAGVRRYLDAQLPGSGLNSLLPRIPYIQPDPEDIGLFHAYVLVCSPEARSARRVNCREDMALYLRHDSRSGVSDGQRFLRDIRDARGRLTLPPLLPEAGD